MASPLPGPAATDLLGIAYRNELDAQLRRQAAEWARTKASTGRLARLGGLWPPPLGIHADEARIVILENDGLGSRRPPSVPE
jgi:hypothetical protein